MYTSIKQRIKNKFILLSKLKKLPFSYLEYPHEPKTRWNKTLGPNNSFLKLMDTQIDQQKESLVAFKKYESNFKEIPINPTNENELSPHWNNVWIPPIDGISLYSFVANKNPKIFLEIGSGNSTKFVRKAIADHKLQTKIISIDPQPRADIDKICDKIIRQSFENIDISSVINELSAGDIIFFDGSHRCLQNSDVTVFFNEFLWKLPQDILIGIHDIFLPFDYPETWLKRFYSEQYILAATLLGLGSKAEVHFASHYANYKGLIKSELGSWWDSFILDQQIDGGCFWFKIK